MTSVEEPIEIGVHDPHAADVRALLERHLAFAHEVTPIDHVHALDVDAPTDAAVTFVAARRAGRLVAVGAIRELDAHHGELKAMHTDARARRQGVGRAVLGHLVSVARTRGYRRVSLETGAGSAFASAHALYLSAGFEPCEPFGEYTRNPYSICMSMEL